MQKPKQRVDIRRRFMRNSKMPLGEEPLLAAQVQLFDMKGRKSNRLSVLSRLVE